jgi:hypothetical protein
MKKIWPSLSITEMTLYSLHCEEKFKATKIQQQKNKQKKRKSTKMCLKFSTENPKGARKLVQNLNILYISLYHIMCVCVAGDKPVLDVLYHQGTSQPLHVIFSQFEMTI